MGANKNLALSHCLRSNNWGNGIALFAAGTGASVNHAVTTGGTHSSAGTATFTISSGAGVISCSIGGWTASVTWATSDTATATALVAALNALAPVMNLVTLVDNSDGTFSITGIETGNMVTGTATLTTDVIDCRGLDDMSFQFVWAGGGSPVGTLDIQVSNNHQQQGSNVQNAGTWTSVTLSPTISVSGNSGSAFANLAGISAQYIRGVFTWASGYGLLDCWFNGRSI